MNKGFFALVAGIAILGPSETRASQLIKVIIPIVESESNVKEIGDLNLKQRAYGSHQIRQPVCDDVNRYFGTKYRAEQMLGNRELSEKVCEMYLSIWATEARIGRKVTDQDRARIWNGGPKGWQKKSTLGYWVKIQKAKKELSVAK